MNAIILSIGDELILGQTVDTNSAWLARQLASIGIPCTAHLTLPDDRNAIAEAIRDSIGRCGVLLITGGLGPTADDLTRHALADVLHQPLELDEAALATLMDFFAKLNRPMPESNRIQAMIPRTAVAIPNPNGTAAGIRATINIAKDLPRVSDEYYERLFSQSHVELRKAVEENLRQRRRLLGAKDQTQIFAMPGVPKEMKAMFEGHVLPALDKSSGGAIILSKTLHTFGLGESAVGELLGPLMDRTRNPSVGTTVSNGIVSIRVNSRFPTHDEAQRKLDATVADCQNALGSLIFGQDDESLPLALSRLLMNKDEGRRMKDEKGENASGSSFSLHPSSFPPLTVTTAESCTGGLLSKLLTDIPGSSDYFKQGWITYSNDAKRDRLGISENILNVHGAVSEPVVTAMATNARRLAKSDFALAISGIAGPTGGTPLKPVGTVCIALAYTTPGAPKSERYTSSATLARTFHFPGDREMIRDRSAKMAITLLRYHLLNQPLPF